MQDLKTIIISFVGAVFALFAPIENFLYAMVILLGANFIVGIVSARANSEDWSTKKALMFFVYAVIFLVIVYIAFAIGHFMGEEEQAIAVVKIICYVAVYVFGTNIFRNLRTIVPKDSQWYKVFDICYYVLSVKFVEKLPFIKKWQDQEEEESHEESVGRG